MTDVEQNNSRSWAMPCALVLVCLGTWFRAAPWWGGELAPTGELLGMLSHLGPFMAANAGHAVLGVAAAAGFLLLAGTWGNQVVAVARTGRGMVAFAAPAVGLCMLSLTLLGMACIGLYLRRTLLPVLATCALAGLPSFHRPWRSAVRRWLALRREWTRGEWLAGVMVAAWAAILIAAPETNYDSLQYHLAGPQAWMRVGKMFTDQVFWYWNIPLPLEMLSVFGLAIDSSLFVRVVGLALLVLGCAGILHRLGGRSAGVSTAGGIMVAILWQASAETFLTTKNDPGAVGLGLLGTALLMDRDGCRPASALIGGVLLGAAGTAKYVMAPDILAAVAAGIVFGMRGSGVVLVLAGALMPSLPWLLKGWLTVGDPLFPVGTMAASHLLGMPWRNQDILAELGAIQEPRDRFMVLPDTIRIAAPMLTVWLAGLPLFIRNRRLLVVSGLFLLALGVQVFVKPGGLFEIERFALWQGVYWTLVGWSALADGVERAGRPLAGMLRAAMILVLCGSGLVHATWVRRMTDGVGLSPALYVTGTVAHDVFKRRALGTYGDVLDAWTAAARQAAPERSTIEVGDACSLDAPTRVRNDMAGPPPIWRAVGEAPDMRRLLIHMRQLNVGWILLNSERSVWGQSICAPYAWSPAMLGLWGQFCRERLRLLARAPRYVQHYGTFWLFAIAPVADPHGQALFLPGIDRALCPAKRARMARDFASSRVDIQDLRKLTGPAVFLDTLEGAALVGMGRPKEGYDLYRKALDAGVVYDMSLTATMVAAAKLHRIPDVVDLAKRSWDWYPESRATIRTILLRLGVMPPG